MLHIFHGSHGLRYDDSGLEAAASKSQNLEAISPGDGPIKDDRSQRPSSKGNGSDMGGLERTDHGNAVFNGADWARIMFPLKPNNAMNSYFFPAGRCVVGL
ncbi:uncharacterized protein PpBr36_06217 [Pyricularia pennisetigena]|uniref:uncharacterized protein n=1 Tax=Pyricularia pennisetigena TaxID=1578925 RepID=UPI00114EB6E6|nr:uncharacterized protein PpBr36_06217 [Pyricularia pennisetigena]TLS23466.1 hypothetical protein PpBr36_06217 [Pyricularia pennisetigena]